MAEKAKPKSEPKPPPEGYQEEEFSIFSYINPFYGRVTASQLLLFTKYFATLNKAGIPVLRTLGTLARQTANIRFRNIIVRMREEVEGGIPLTWPSAKTRKSSAFCT